MVRANRKEKRRAGDERIEKRKKRQRRTGDV